MMVRHDEFQVVSGAWVNVTCINKLLLFEATFHPFRVILIEELDSFVNEWFT